MAVVLLDVVVAVDQVLALAHNSRSAFADSLRRKLALLLSFDVVGDLDFARLLFGCYIGTAVDSVAGKSNSCRNSASTNQRVFETVE